MKKKIKILLIEDSPTDVDLMKLTLQTSRRFEFGIDRAKKMEQGLELLDNNAYDCVVMDLNLPDAKGAEILYAINGRRRVMPIIVLTGIADEAMADEALREGAQDYIVKEAGYNGLERAINYAMERKKVEIQKARIKDEFSSLVENAPIMMFVLNKESKVEKVNKVTRKFTDFTNEQVVGMSVGQLISCIHSNDVKNGCGFGPSCEKCFINRAVMDVLKTDNEYLKETVKHKISRNNHEEERVFVFSAVGIKDEENKSVLVSIDDITEKKIEEKKLVDAYEALKEVDKLKSNFISIISHELRTPVTIIKGFIAFLLKEVGGPITKQQKEFLDTIKNNNERQKIIIDDLIDMSKIEAGIFTIEKNEKDIVQIVESCITDMDLIADQNGMSLKKNIEIENIIVDIDKGRIVQAMINLINNAIKYSGQGSSIIVGLNMADEKKIPEYLFDKIAKDKSYYNIYVKDDGIGIDKEKLETIFQRFYQIENANTRTKQGVGLGLSIARNIIDAHDGFIWCESGGTNKGATFNVMLPIN